MVRHALSCAMMLALGAAGAAALDPGFPLDAYAKLPEPQRAALGVARDFMAAVSERNLERVLTRSAVPFLWDRKQTHETSEALRAAFFLLFKEELNEKITVTADEIYPVGAAIGCAVSAEAMKYITDSVGKGGLLYFAYVQNERIALILKQSNSGIWHVVGFED